MYLDIQSLLSKYIFIINIFTKLYKYFKRNCFYYSVFIFYYPFFLFTNKNKSDLPYVFIIGAPRTGSTILYQTLTNCFKIRYIDNLCATWYKHLSFGMWLSNLRFGLKPHNNFDAVHGNTKNFGEHAPSECGQFWYRWLSKNKDFVDFAEIPRTTVSRIKYELSKANSLYNEPILFKNLNMGQRLRLIKEFAPDSKIIFIQRDPRFTINSILKARRKIEITNNKIWSVKPKNYKVLEKLTEIEMCCAQVYYLEKQIREDLAEFDKLNVKSIHYNNLSEDLIDELGNWLCLDRKDKAEIPQFRKDKLSLLKREELNKLQSAVDKYDFDKINFIE